MNVREIVRHTDKYTVREIARDKKKETETVLQIRHKGRCRNRQIEG